MVERIDYSSDEEYAMALQHEETDQQLCYELQCEVEQAAREQVETTDERA